MRRRAIDTFLALTALVLLSPVLLVVAIAVRLSSPGPVIFRQVRVGKGGRPFEILKFRTMRSARGGAEGDYVTASGDPRVTPLGRRLRRLKLDELPQLVNVLRGEMALVGPRPEVPAYVALWPTGERETILSVRPGLTDPVSLALRDESDVLASASDPERFYREVLLPRKAAWYAEYVRDRTARDDLAVLLGTVRAVLVPHSEVRPTPGSRTLLDQEVHP